MFTQFTRHRSAATLSVLLLLGAAAASTGLDPES